MLCRRSPLTIVERVADHMPFVGGRDLGGGALELELLDCALLDAGGRVRVCAVHTTVYQCQPLSSSWSALGPRGDLGRDPPLCLSEKAGAPPAMMLRTVIAASVQYYALLCDYSMCVYGWKRAKRCQESPRVARGKQAARPNRQERVGSPAPGAGSDRGLTCAWLDTVRYSYSQKSRTAERSVRCLRNTTSGVTVT